MKTTAINDIFTASSTILEEILNQPILTYPMVKRIRQRFEMLKNENEANASKLEGETERLTEIKLRLCLIESEFLSQSQIINLDKPSRNIKSCNESFDSAILEMDEVLIKNIIQWIPFPSRLNYTLVSKLFKKIIHEMLLNESDNTKFIILNDIIIDPIKLIENSNDQNKDANNNKLVSLKQLRTNKIVKEFFAQTNELAELHASEVKEDKKAELPACLRNEIRFYLIVIGCMSFTAFSAIIGSLMYTSSDKFQNVTNLEKKSITATSVFMTIVITLGIGTLIFILRQLYLCIHEMQAKNSYSRTIRLFANPNEDIPNIIDSLGEKKPSVLQNDNLEKIIIDVNQESISGENNKFHDNVKWTLSRDVYSNSNFLTIFPDSESSGDERNISLNNYPLSINTATI